MGRLLTLRGVVPKDTRERIFFFDSNIMNTGWKIKEMHGMNMSQGRAEVDCVINSVDRNITLLDWDRNTTIACLKYMVNTGTNCSLVDRNHVIVANLYLTNLDNTYDAAYLIVLEEIKISAEQNIMYQLKEVAQNVDSP